MRAIDRGAARLLRSVVVRPQPAGTGAALDTTDAARAGRVLLGVALVGSAAGISAWLLLRHRTAPPAEPATPPRSDAADDVRLGQLNAHNLFDAVDDPHHQDDLPTAADYEVHLHKLALTVRDTMQAPDVITLEEVENQQVLDALVAQPELAPFHYVPVLREGRDPRGIDVAVLYRADRMRETAVTTIDPSSPSPSGRLSKTFTRPPLAIDLQPLASTGDDARVRVIAAHFTSRLQGEDGEDRRRRQAIDLATAIDGFRQLDASLPIAVAGDLNMTAAEAPYALLVGTADAAAAPRLLAPLDQLDSATRYSYRYGSARDLFDHVLLTPISGWSAVDAAIPHSNSDASAASIRDAASPAGSSDHDPVLVTLRHAG